MLLPTALLPLLLAAAAGSTSASASAFRLPSAQDALGAADALLHPGSGPGPVSGSSNPQTLLSPDNELELSSIRGGGGGDDFVRVTSARHPGHSVRIKETTGWCDPDVRSYTGYLDVARGDGKELFFYFFESRDKPKEDPVIMWINGGPGCSSALGLFMELGPCSVKDDPKSANDTQVNPYSWNKNANVFFLDEPIGVGFSYGEHKQTVKTTEEAALDIQAFVQIFFDTFKEFKGREFHMAGESYGGRYLPLFASAVHDGNKDLVAAKKEPINLKSVMIGNGVTDFFTTTESYFPFQCTVHGGLTEPVQSIGNCIQMAEAVPKCHRFAKNGCMASHDPTACQMAVQYCEETLGESFIWAGKNPYDVSKPCTLEELETSLCYPETDKIGTYLNLHDVRHTLGVNKAHAGWASCDNTVNLNFHLALDQVGQTWLYVAALLERGVRVLNYAGTFDFICNHIGNEMWMERLEWSGKEGYNKQGLDEWKVGGEVAGSYKSYKNLSLLKVLYAGHMVPFDKPKESLAMLTSWLGETSFAA